VPKRQGTVHMAKHIKKDTAGYGALRLGRETSELGDGVVE